MLSYIILGAIFICFFWYAAIKPMSYWKRKGIKQGNATWLFGDNLGVLLRKESFAEYIKRLYKQYPRERYNGIYQFTVPTLLIRDPDLIKQITVKDFDHFVDHRTVVPEGNDPLWAKNLFSLKGERWKDMRPILSPQFTSSKMKSIFLLMTDCVQVFVDHFSKQSKHTIELEMRDALSRLGVDVIASIAFGVKVDSMLEPKNEFYLMGREATDFTGIWKSFKFFGYQIMPKIYDIFSVRLFNIKVTNFFQNVVDETLKLRAEKNIVRNDLIQLLIEARKGVKRYEENPVVDTGFATVQEYNVGKSDVSAKCKDISNVDIAAQAMIFFFGGFDTTANLMCFITYELAVNPDIQQRLRQEIIDTKKECGEKVTYEALMKMKYLDMVVSETIRKWPAGIQLDRMCTKPYTIEPKNPGEKPLRIEVGDFVWIPVYGLHHDPKYFPEPEKFDPERFSDENKQNLNPYIYMPFGAGPRNCIGSRFALLEAKTLIFYLLSNFELVPTKKTTIPARLAKNNFMLLLEGGFHLGLKSLNA